MVIFYHLYKIFVYLRLVVLVRNVGCGIVSSTLEVIISSESKVRFLVSFSIFILVLNDLTSLVSHFIRSSEEIRRFFVSKF